MQFLDFIFPKKCFTCGKGRVYFCESCVAKVQNPKPFCPVCMRPSVDGMTHTSCKTPQSLDGIVSLWKYEGVIRAGILALKYRFAYDVCHELAELCINKLTTDYRLPTTVLVPIPLHATRERWRGFNQSEKVGQLVAKGMGWRFIPDLLIKKVATKSQTELKKEDRMDNIRGVFVLNSKYKLGESNYLLFDDVWTTGSTLKEACKVLKRKGANSVWGLTICR